MKIIISGDLGFLGRHLVTALSPKYEVIGLNRSHGDLSQIDVVKNHLHSHRPDVIIHAAALSNVQACEDDREFAYLSHVGVSEQVALAAKAIGARVIFISSDQVYDKYQPTIWREYDEPIPKTYYGQLKLAAEHAILTHVPQASILRLGWQYCATLGHEHGFYKLVRTVSERQIVLAYHPQAIQYPCDVNFSVDVITALVEQRLRPDIYNVTQPTNLTLGELFAKVAQRYDGVRLEADFSREATMLMAYPQALIDQGVMIPPLFLEDEK